MGIGWSPRIGDPTAIGWVTVVAYFVTAILCLCAGRVAARDSGGAGIWPWLAVALVALGVNKQLDLQTLVVSIGRRVAVAHGWYESRRTVQAIFIAVLAVTAAVSCGAVAVATRDRPASERRALIGIVVLSAFVVVRAASFHHVDRLLGITASGVRLNNVLELGGILLIALPALAGLAGTWPPQKVN